MTSISRLMATTSFVFIMSTAGHAQAASQAPASTDATAQPSAGLGEIVVTAQKRSENLQNVPISVAAVSSQQLAATGVVSTATLSGAVAGLAINSTATYFAPHIRGVGTASFGPGVENPVALYVDNVYYASQLIAPTDLSDVAQVAVLKGPQGTLFGRNSTGGVIQMTTRDPSADFGGELQTQLDQYLTSRNFLYVTGGLTDDLKTNLSIKYTTQENGWGRNLVTGNDNHRIFHDVSARNKWTWTPGSGTTLRLSLDYTNLSNNMGPNLRPAPGSQPLLYVPALGVGYESSNKYDTANFMDGRNHLESGGASLAIEQDVGFARVVSITAYRRYSFDSRFDAGGTAIPLSGSSFNQSGKQITQEVQLVSRETKPVSWTAGLFYFYGREKLFGPVASIFSPLTEPELGGFGGEENDFFYNTPLTTESIAGFGQATWELLPGTRLTGGLRYTHEKRRYSGSQGVLVDQDPTPVLTLDVPDGTRTTESKWSFRASVDHDFTSDILGYASFNRGFKSGGFNGLGILPESAVPYKPEKLDAYEVGAKAELFDRTLRLNPSFFYYNYSNIQVTEFQAAQTLIINGAKAQLYGVDIDAEWRPTRDLTFNGGFEWVHSKFKSFPNAPSYSPDPVNGGNIGPLTIDAAGNRLPFTPKFTLDVGANYETRAAGGKLDLNVSDTYNSGYFTEPDNRLHQGAYNWLNTSIMWTAPGNRFSATLWGRNLLNKIVITQLSGFANEDSADFANPPRTYGFTLRYRFGALN